MKKIIQKNNPLTTTVLRAVLWRKLVWHGLCILRFITTYLIISVEYPTTKIENSICISSKMRSIQIMVHYYKTKKNGSLRPHFTTTPLYVYSVCTTRPGNCAIYYYQKSKSTIEAIPIYSFPFDQELSKPYRYITICCFEYYFGYILLPSEVPLLLLLFYE